MTRPFVLNHNVFRAPVTQQFSPLERVLSAIGGNSGNTYITYALARFADLDDLNGVANAFSEEAIAAIDVDAVNEAHSHVFLCLQDHLRVSANSLPWSALSNLISRIRIPIVAFSVGANAIDLPAQALAASLSPEMVQFFRLLGERAVSIGIRGHYTAEVLEALSVRNYATVGCPAWFEAGPRRCVPYPPFDPSRPVAATGLFSHPEIGKIHFFLQDEALFLQALFAGEPPSPEHAALLKGTYPNYAACALAAFFAGRMSFFTSMDDWRAMLARHFLFAAGTRVHGTFIAMNAGLPALCTAGDMRAKEMCALFHIPHKPGICAADLPLESLYAAADPAAANAAYPQLYRRFVDWLDTLGINRGYRSPAPPWPVGQPQALAPLEAASRLSTALGLHAPPPS